MKTMLSSLLLLAALAVGLERSTIRAEDTPSEPTAFWLMKEGNKYVGDQSKDKVVQVRSEKSVGSITPNIWYVVYYDPTATLKSVEVKFGAGKMMSVERPLRLLEPLFGGSEPIDQAKLKVDSDEAIRTAIKEPLLANLKVVATQPKLENSAAGPVWYVKIWTLKVNDPAVDVEVGQVLVSAETGSVLKRDIHLARAD